MLKQCNAKFKTIPLAQELSEQHKEKRVEWTKSHMRGNIDLKKRIFLDEKKFNMTGKDGNSMVWIGPKKTKLRRLAPFNPRKSVHVLCYFGIDFKPRLVRYTESLNGERYKNILKNIIIKQARKKLGTDIVIQQDNARCHISKKIKELALTEKIIIDQQPALSFDLNPVERAWALLSRKVYADGRTFKEENELWNAIKQAWEEITQETLNNLITPFFEHCFQIACNKGIHLQKN